MKTLKINVPEGYEIDKEQSTFENIVFKEIKNELLKSWDELRSITGYAVEDRGRISVFNLADTVKQNRHVFRRLEQAEASIALAQLSQLREVYRQGWKPDWTDEGSDKYCIRYYSLEATIDCLLTIECFFSFQSREIAEQFLENFRDLMEQAKPLMS
jgi:hypothetical protein